MQRNFRLSGTESHAGLKNLSKALFKLTNNFLLFDDFFFFCGNHLVLLSLTLVNL